MLSTQHNALIIVGAQEGAALVVLSLWLLYICQSLPIDLLKKLNCGL